ncbi:hypothetical protein HBH42_249690 [Parastagonospora nodorum]|nr:hypothetical protein HBH42_249690 [Parastagonospora nodorum]
MESRWSQTATSRSPSKTIPTEVHTQEMSNAQTHTTTYQESATTLSRAQQTRECLITHGAHVGKGDRRLRTSSSAAGSTRTSATRQVGIRDA